MGEARRAFHAILGSLLGRAAPPEGSAEAAAATADPGAAERFGGMPVLEVLALKVMHSHLRNRHQRLGPPPSAFGSVDAEQAALLLRAAIAAAQADGRVGPQEERRIGRAAEILGMPEAERRDLAGRTREPVALEPLLRQVHDPHTASLFYAASLLVVDRHSPVNRAYLHYLAARLRLPADTLTRLHGQFGFTS
jgi:uncharacterized membrane protein YebE (DUF533 family)